MKCKLFILTISFLFFFLTFTVLTYAENINIAVGSVFQTQDGFGDLPFVGVDVSVGANVYKDRNNHELWIKMFFQKTWPFKLSSLKTFTTYVRSSLGLGPEFVFNYYDDFLVGLSPGALYRITDCSDGSYVSEYGLFAEGFTQIEILKWLVLQPAVDIKMFDYLSTLEIGVSLRCLLRL